MALRRNRQFENERGNAVEVVVEVGPSPDLVRLQIIGPCSTAENVVTWDEADALADLIQSTRGLRPLPIHNRK